MGEYAEYMLNGDDCSQCGEYIGSGPGYPRVCRACGGGASTRHTSPVEWKSQRQRKRELRDSLVEKAKPIIEELGMQRASTPYQYNLRIVPGKPMVCYYPGLQKWSMGGHVHQGNPQQFRAWVQARRRELQAGN